MTDKRSESQFPDPNEHDIPEGIGWEWTSESQNEQGEAAERERTKIPYLSQNAEDIMNSKRSRGERL
jgi:hypothetical protein